MAGPTLAEVEQEVSVADSLRAAMSEANATGAVPEGGALGSQSAEPAAPPGAVPYGSKSGQPRAADGKFTKTAAEEGDETKTVVEEPGAKAPAVKEPGAADPADPPEPIEPPAGWSLKEQETFRKLAPDAQKFVMDRVEAATKSVGLPAEYQEMERVIAPRRAAFASTGLTPAAAISQTLQLSDAAAKNPIGFIKWFMDQRGVTLGHLGVKQQAPAAIDPEDDPANQDPVVARLTNQITTLERQVQQLGGHVTARSQAEEQALQSQANQEVQNFGMAVDDKGLLKHPYFNEVKQHVLAFITSGVADDPPGSGRPSLERAYDMACRAHPEVNSKISAVNAAREQRERQKAEQEKAKNARRAGATVNGAPGSVTPQQSTGDLRADLRGLFHERGMYGTNTI